MEDRVQSVLRYMAWERAKGEMESMLGTYYSGLDGNKFEIFREKLGHFIEDVESKGLQE